MRTPLSLLVPILVVTVLTALPAAAQPSCPGPPPCSECSCSSGCVAFCCASGQLNVCANFVCRAHCQFQADSGGGTPAAADSSCGAGPDGLGAFLAGLGQESPAETAP